MTFLRGWVPVAATLHTPALRRVPAFLAALVLGCGGDMPLPEARPGIVEGAAGLIEVVVVDLDSRARIAGAAVVIGGTSLTTDASGTSVFTRAGIEAFDVDASAEGHVAARWTGVLGGRVVLALRASSVREDFAVTIAGLAADEHAVVSVTTRPALFQPSSVRLGAASESALAPCAAGAAGECAAALEADAAPSGRIVLIAVTDDAGAARRLVRFDGALTGDTLDLDVGESLALETLVVSIPTLPIDLTAVVGVPGISFGSAVGVLGFEVEGPSPVLPMPVVTGMLATRWALFMASAQDGGATDPMRRSVLVDRRVEAGVDSFAAWLAPPALTSSAVETALLTPSPGASVHAIDWISLEGDVVRTDLVFDASAVLSRPGAARGARVRALDTNASPDALDLDAAERAVTRFAEADVTFAP